MRFSEITEQVGTIGSVPSSASPAVAPGLTGNVGALSDPKLQAAQLATQKQQKLQSRQAIMQQIAALNKQLADLNRTA
jgi:hypothetical protein